MMGDLRIRKKGRRYGIGHLDDLTDALYTLVVERLTDTPSEKGDCN